MRLPLRNLAAVALLSVVCPGCNIEDIDGDGSISVDEFVAGLQNGFCGNGNEDQPVEEETPPTTPDEENQEELTDPTSQFPTLSDLN